MKLTEQQLQNFWSKVDKSGECWEWTAYKNKWGYGVVRINGISFLAHRISFAIASGYAPRLMVCHKCDNPSCCNPRHLFEGTRRDNMIDKTLKGRAALKLKPEEVREIRATRGTHREAAKRFGVSEAVISNIRNNKIWTWLQ